MKTIIVYASMTGTTELMAHSIAEELEKAGEQVVVKEAFDSYAEELKAYDRIIVGSYTWGDGELSDEILDFHNEVLHLDLAGKSAAIFGPGDSTYEHFARAVDLLEATFQKQGCEIIIKGLKVDSSIEKTDEIKTTCRKFANKILASFKAIHVI